MLPISICCSHVNCVSRVGRPWLRDGGVNYYVAAELFPDTRIMVVPADDGT